MSRRVATESEYRFPDIAESNRARQYRDEYKGGDYQRRCTPFEIRLRHADP
jgi:hypothetical protein